MPPSTGSGPVSGCPGSKPLHQRGSTPACNCEQPTNVRTEWSSTALSGCADHPGGLDDSMVLDMSVRERILRLIAGGGTGGKADREELVVFATVEPYEAPILREVLDQKGIEVHGSESLTPGTWVDKVVLKVARRDLDAATSVLREHRGLENPDTE